MNISSLIGEATQYDKKLTVEERRPKSWLKSVSAFANGIGGVLLFGIDDEDHVVGLENARAASEKISELLQARIDPIPQTLMEIHKEGNAELVLLKIFPGQETPYYYAADGNRTAYIRVGNESLPANAVSLKRLILQSSGKTYDSLSSPYKYADYSFTKLRSVYRQRTGAELDENDFISFGLADETGMLTNAGALLADECPIRHSRLFCTRWYGLDKASGIMEAMDDKEFSGSLISLLQNGEEFIKNNTKKRWKKTADGRIEMPDYPERAVFECIVNGLIHRDYLSPDSEIHIDIYDNRLEIYSPGGMCDGSQIQDLDLDRIPSRRRNPIIADIFSRMNYMERRGSGFKKMKADYQAAVNYRPDLAPRFYSDNHSFWVTLYNLNGSVSAEETDDSSKKQLFDTPKTVVSEENQLFDAIISSLKISKPTRENIEKLYRTFGTDTAFGRTEIRKITRISSPTAAGELIRKLKIFRMVIPVKGQGKGKYKFHFDKK